MSWTRDKAVGATHEGVRPIEGVRSNLPRFLLLVLQVALVGSALGVTRTLVPLLGESRFGVGSSTVALSFIVAFGLAKAPLNLASGALADRFGRKRILVAGWLLGIPFPLLLVFAQSWGWVIAAMTLLGLQQGLCWSTTIFMKVDVAGPRRRGFAIGINEFTGYAGTAVMTYASGALAGSLRSMVWPFLLGEAIVVAGLVTALYSVDETSSFVGAEGRDIQNPGDGRLQTKGFAALCQAGLITKIADVAAWGLLPLLLASRGLRIHQIAVVAAVYPATWAALQPLTGWLSDRFSRKPFIVIGMFVQGAGLVMTGYATGTAASVVAIAVLGAGTGLVYPVLLAAAGDLAAPSARATSIGHYRLWRDLGFVVGGVVAGTLAESTGITGAFRSLGLFSVVSGILVALLFARARTAPDA